MDDCFEILGVPETATAEELKTAYRRLADKAHPDKGGSAPEFIYLNAAYMRALMSVNDRVCKECCGTGAVTVALKNSFRFAAIRCPLCNGTGK